MHMGCTANIIIKDVINIFASISKIMCFLLMGRRNRERCNPCRAALYFTETWKYICVSYHLSTLRCCSWLKSFSMVNNSLHSKSASVQVILALKKQQSITWTNVDPDLCHHMVSLGPSRPQWGDSMRPYNCLHQWFVSKMQNRSR